MKGNIGKYISLIIGAILLLCAFLVGYTTTGISIQSKIGGDSVIQSTEEFSKVVQTFSNFEEDEEKSGGSASQYSCAKITFSSWGNTQAYVKKNEEKDGTLVRFENNQTVYKTDETLYCEMSRRTRVNDTSNASDIEADYDLYLSKQIALIRFRKLNKLSKHFYSSDSMNAPKENADTEVSYEFINSEYLNRWIKIEESEIIDIIGADAISIIYPYEEAIELLNQIKMTGYVYNANEEESKDLILELIQERMSIAPFFDSDLNAEVKIDISDGKSPTIQAEYNVSESIGDSVFFRGNEFNTLTYSNINNLKIELPASVPFVAGVDLDKLIIKSY